MIKVLLGWMNIKEEREYTQYTTYAADHIEHVIKPGRYPVYGIFEGSLVPTWYVTRFDSEVVSGGYYSGFGGVNFGFTPAQKGPSHYSIQNYFYYLKDDKDFEVVEKYKEFVMSGKHWDMVRAGKITWDDIKDDKVEVSYYPNRG